MSIDATPDRARALWRELAAAPDAAFGTPGVCVSPGSSLAPPSWVGVVTIGDTALITTPTDRAADSVRTALNGLPATRLTDPAALTALLPVSDTLGPAVLAYLTPDALRPPGPTDTPTERLTPGDTALRALSEEAGEADAGESGLEEITSPVFAVRDEGARVLAAAGYAHWPRDTAHLCVLTAPDARGRGLARQVASEATAHALAAGLLPQWRARPAASRRVAAALGYRELGAQLSVRLR
ncbi:GNAT family N-acetyltransferase [Streptomyces sp. NPDC101178]|uniref:GNAT family N-acetyltransferase n=1 Tax=Streptomyces sp. NPDC101178 TaxID=3366124 RepID=UPI00382326CC